MTEEQEGGRRAKRRCARNRFTSSAMPSAIHYVGYVEDDETPEMITAKFAELERIQAAPSAPAAAAQLPAEATEEQEPLQQAAAEQEGGRPISAAPAPEPAPAAPQPQPGGGLTDAQLLEVFKQTSMFNVRTALGDNAMLLGIDDILEATGDRYGDSEAVSEDEDMLRAFWSDEDDVLLSDTEDDEEGGGRRRRRGGSRMQRQGSGRSLLRNAAGVKARHNVITAFNPVTQALVRRKVRAGAGERDEIYQLRVPPAPIPPAWGRTVQPYVPPYLRSQRPMAVPVPPALLKAMREGGRAMDIEAMQGCTYREEPSIAAADWGGLLASRAASGSSSSSSGGGFQAVLINPGWAAEGQGSAAMQHLAKLPMRRLVPRGFVFIFVEKQHVQALCRQMRAWGYCYIENLTWVYLRPSNHILRLPARYANASHLTLYMFRREGNGKDIELRHQRNPDVTFDCLYRADGKRRAVPEETFVAIETLLPTGKGAFLELWAPQGVHRPGWTHVVEVGAGS